MIDLSGVIEDYVSADNLAANGSTFKGDTTSDTLNHPMHLIDKFSLNKNSARHMALRINVEGVGTAGIIENITGTGVTSMPFLITNGYLKDTDELQNRTTAAPDNWFGYNMNRFFIKASDSTRRFLTNAPSIQYANPDDYGTISFLVRDFTVSQAAKEIRLAYTDSSGGSQGFDIITREAATGSSAWNSNQGVDNTQNQLQFFGCFPANLRNWSSNFKTAYDAGLMDGGKITFQFLPYIGSASSKTYTIQLNCPNKKNFKSIRLCWLNQWGAWDYYTFIQKSITKISTKATTYDQLQGSWSSPYYNANGFKGGKKTFRKNAIESITMNTDFVIEDDNVMFEELTNSPEVYILREFQQRTFNTDTLNRYVQPVTLKSTSFTKKTIANDKLIQYTFEVEKSRTLRTQSI
jgi:hypothetical protein